MRARAHTHTNIIEWKIVEVLKNIYKMIFKNTLNFKAQLITYI